MKLVIESLGGNCPVQGEGTINGFKFDFRARGATWSVDIYDGKDEPWHCWQPYGEGPYAAGWMSEEEARAFIEIAAERYAKEHP